MTNNLKMTVELQKISQAPDMPTLQNFELWVQVALEDPHHAVLIRLVDEIESQQLNAQYRGKNNSTNVLSFPDHLPFEINPFIGDLVICAPLVSIEAKAQNKPISAHWAHLVIHGTLHLRGFDHIQAADAKIMENLEIQLLKKFNIPNPYENH